MAVLRSQRSNNDCGPTCVANALNILGYDIKVGKTNDLCRLKKDGTSSEDLARAFDRYGFDSEEKIYRDKEKAWNWIKRDTKNGLPVIISVDDTSHWLLILRVGKNEVQIFDPGDRIPAKITKSRLIQRWKFFEDTNNARSCFHGLAIIPYKDKSIKAVLLRERLLATIDVK